jgi:hypothetical protein
MDETYRGTNDGQPRECEIVESPSKSYSFEVDAILNQAVHGNLKRMYNPTGFIINIKLFGKPERGGSLNITEKNSDFFQENSTIDMLKRIIVSDRYLACQLDLFIRDNQDFIVKQFDLGKVVNNGFVPYSFNDSCSVIGNDDIYVRTEEFTESDEFRERIYRLNK